MPDTLEIAEIKTRILESFDNTEWPADIPLTDLDRADARQLEADFANATDWRQLDSRTLDRAPGGLGNALSLFSDVAFHFYLPAYLLADLEGELQQTDPVFHLTLGLDDASKLTHVDTRSYEDRTWFDHATHKFSIFDRAQCAAIVAYLGVALERTQEPTEQAEIAQAIRNYWSRRAGGPAE